jgi:hypothetical protein
MDNFDFDVLTGPSGPVEPHKPVTAGTVRRWGAALPNDPERSGSGGDFPDPTAETRAAQAQKKE